MEDSYWGRTVIGGGQLLVEDSYWWRIVIGGG